MHRPGDPPSEPNRRALAVFHVCTLLSETGQDVSRAEAVGLLGEKYRMAEDEAQAAIDEGEERGWISLGRPR
jgi:hypothetical protein